MDNEIYGALVDFIDSYLNDVYTAIPCLVVRMVDSQKGIVDVRPLLKRKGFDGVDEDRPIILGVQLMQPGTATSLISLPVVDGDIVLCVFSQRGLDAFKAGDGTTQAPTDFRMFDRRDAIAIPGLFPFGLHPNLKRTLPSSEGDLSLTANIGTPQEVTVRLTTEGEVKIISPMAVSVEAPTVSLSADASIVLDAPAINLTGVLTINSAPYAGHLHSGVLTGPATTGPIVS